MAFFAIFSKKFSENLNLSFFLQILKFPMLVLGAARVLSRIANLASKYDCSIFFNFRDMTFFVVFSQNLLFT